MLAWAVVFLVVAAVAAIVGFARTDPAVRNAAGIVFFICLALSVAALGIHMFPG